MINLWLVRSQLPCVSKFWIPQQFSTCYLIFVESTDAGQTGVRYGFQGVRTYQGKLVNRILFHGFNRCFIEFEIYDTITSNNAWRHPATCVAASAYGDTLKRSKIRRFEVTINMWRMFSSSKALEQHFIRPPFPDPLHLDHGNQGPSKVSGKKFWCFFPALVKVFHCGKKNTQK